MKAHENANPKQSEPKPSQDEVAKKAYAIYEKEGRPQGHADQNWLEAEAQLQLAVAFRAPGAAAPGTTIHDV